ncbi:MAG: AraC family transcriptional regulator [Saprospiraceae bacterium]|nr:AraC family transcriptional regulator [Saprospiraceae bacterium]
MVIEHRTIELWGKKVFEKAVVKPPLRNPNPLPEEACFLYVLEGGNRSFSEEEQVNLQQDEAVLMKCGQYMYDGQADPNSGHCGLIAVHFYPEVLERLYADKVPAFLKNSAALPFMRNMTKVNAQVPIKKYIEGLLYYFDHPHTAPEELLILKLKEIILLLLHTPDAPAILEIMHNLFSPKAFTLKQVVEAHIFSDLQIGDLAKLCQQSLATFKREFKKVYNDSPANYIRHRRLEKAADLLQVSDDPINHIAYDCQFKDVAHFSTAFKSKYQLTPSQYRMSFTTK